MIPYADKNYAAKRLVGTIVRWNGKAVKVKAIGELSVVQILKTGDDEAVPYDSIDITPVPLGFCNFNGEAIYVSRSPVREDWKQGLRANTLRWVSLPTVKNNNEDEEDEEENPARLKIRPWINRADEREMIPSNVLANTIEGVYPSIENVVASIKKGGKKLVSLAYNRYFAVDTNFNIYHRGDVKIGKFTNPENKTYQLDEKHWWAKEALEESFNA